jgi:hypothetical protein
MFASQDKLLGFYKQYFQALNAVLDPTGPSFNTFRGLLEQPKAMVRDRKQPVKGYCLVEIVRTRRCYKLTGAVSTNSTLTSRGKTRTARKPIGSFCMFQLQDRTPNTGTPWAA